MKNKISDVRNIMIEAMEALLHPEEGSKFSVDEAKALASLGKVIVDSAKVEVNAMNIAFKYDIHYKPSGFLDANQEQKQLS